jgi:protein MpaA
MLKNKSHKSGLLKKRTLNIFIILMTITFIAGLCGCDQPVNNEFTLGASPDRTVKPPLLTTFTAGFSVENRKIEYSILGSGPDVIFVIATIHGNEHAGTPIVRRLTSMLKKREDILKKHKLIILPMANPDGYYHNQRHNANGVDLNRNFAAYNRVNNTENGKHALSEPESRIIEKLILRYKPSRIISFHEPLACLDYDGPGLRIANAMAKHTNLPVDKLGARPGSLGAYAGETLGIPIITIEFTPRAKLLSTDQLWQKYANMTLAAVLYKDPLSLNSILLAK